MRASFGCIRWRWLVVLLQVWVFIRAVRRGGNPFELALLAVLTALAVATHFSAAFIFVAEALWLVAWPLMPWRRGQRSDGLAARRSPPRSAPAPRYF